MKQEDKELLLKDLCARLPYGVKVKSAFYNCDGTIWKHENEILTVGLLAHPITRYKPYLFPLSSMTEEQEIEYDATFDTIVYEDGRKDSVMTYKSFDWLNKNNFDYRGLIPKGLAIDATGLNIY